MWDKYIDDKLHIIITILLFGKNATYNSNMIDESQEWLFAWSLLYFKGMGINFPTSRYIYIQQITAHIYFIFFNNNSNNNNNNLIVDSTNPNLINDHKL